MHISHNTVFWEKNTHDIKVLLPAWKVLLPAWKDHGKALDSLYKIADKVPGNKLKVFCFAQQVTLYTCATKYSLALKGLRDRNDLTFTPVSYYTPATYSHRRRILNRLIFI